MKLISRFFIWLARIVMTYLQLICMIALYVLGTGLFFIVLCFFIVGYPVYLFYQLSEPNKLNAAVKPV
jgi:hypothetical protein